LVSLVNVVVVSYNSRNELRACVEPLAAMDDVQVTVVDNASSDDSPTVVEDLPVNVIRLPKNGGFAHGCNAGWRADSAPFVLFLNPDAKIDEPSLRMLTEVAGKDRVGGVAPRIVDSDGELEFSLRRFPRLRSTYAQALFMHRLAPRASWTDETIRNPGAYQRPGSPEWVSGACILVRRAALEEIGGLDEGFFMYSEDVDLCRRLRNAGYDIRLEPEAVCVHHGGRSAPRAELLPVLARSRMRYANKHHGAVFASLQRAGIGLGALTHMLLSTKGPAQRAGYRHALRAVLSGAGRT
jgi:N-acetylglucosaminyl-diphospho-decaprenol L-rhamnosyltransferase